MASSASCTMPPLLIEACAQATDGSPHAATAIAVPGLAPLNLFRRSPITPGVPLVRPVQSQGV
ncbi:hypothetical protein K3217_14125 [bacterium BD-1]|nr:hypothetical protein [Ottowia caeni]